MSEVRRVLLANGQYIEIVQETGTSTGAVMSQSAVTYALNSKANASHNHAAGNITGGTFGTAMIADGAITSGKLADNTVTSGKLATNAVTTVKILDKAVTKAKLADDVISSLPASSYETLAVTANVTNNSTNDVSGMQVVINGITYTFNSTHKIYVMIPYNQVYTVKPITDGIFKSNTSSQTFTAETANRSVTLSYTINDGAYIEDKDYGLYAYQTWSSGNNANANSVVVASANHSCRIALTQISSSMAMNPNYTDPWETYLSGTTNAGTTDSTVALTDYNGAVNTQLIVEKCQSSTEYAAGACNAYTFPDGTTKGYLPSLGELNLAYQNKAAIDKVLAACGGTVFASGYHWSSTFYGSDGNNRGCWILRWSVGNVYDYYLTSYYYVRAFGAH